jgi:hypothetical protein
MESVHEKLNVLFREAVGFDLSHGYRDEELDDLVKIYGIKEVIRMFQIFLGKHPEPFDDEMAIPTFLDWFDRKKG